MFQIIFVSVRPDIIRLLGSQLQECLKCELSRRPEAIPESRVECRLQGFGHLERLPTGEPDSVD